MNQHNKRTVFHIEAILTSIIWGTTFVSTKVLITHGMVPEQIMLLRFLLAYVCIWTISPHKLWANNLKDELMFVGVGLAGGSLYFLAENTALKFTQACNVSILISITPLLTAVASSFFYKSERINKSLLFGAVVALIGVTCVVLNGRFVLKLNPLGDILTITASLMWVVYGLILKKLQIQGYSSIFITRKVFFYGIITILPVFLMTGASIDFSVLSDFTVLGNLCFLGIVASFLCYLSWNYVVNKIGVVTVTNYLYIQPFATFIVSAIVLHERITPIAILGGVLILAGVYLSQRLKSSN
jgi:drug/metabolite transporter (DMT)-like permease